MIEARRRFHEQKQRLHEKAPQHRVLAIEDDTSTYRLIREYLPKRTALFAAATLERALALLGRGRRFDLILFDQGLPDGSDATQDYLSVMQHAEGAPVVVLSGADCRVAIEGVDVPFYHKDQMESITSLLPH